MSEAKGPEPADKMDENSAAEDQVSEAHTTRNTAAFAAFWRRAQEAISDDIKALRTMDRITQQTLSRRISR